MIPSSTRSRKSIPGRRGGRDGVTLRELAAQIFTRTADAPLIGGNSVKVLRDARENFPAWLEAISGARHYVLFENYIIADDKTGRQFVAALTEKVRSGIQVFLIHDWLGGLGVGSDRVLEPLIEAGGQVRCFNPPRFESPLGWLTRDHRKMISIDGVTGFVSGLCVSRKWEGDPSAKCEPWRDTGIEIRGPAVTDIEAAFEQTWVAAGGGDELPESGEASSAGDVSLRILASQPSTAGIYRLDQMIAAMARKTLWLTDAYFLGFAPYVQALRAAANDGVDVRLLVPGTSDVPILTRFSRAGYRPLLESGIRVFEWNGSMLHAKTAVADGRWARVGSTNLNLASWIGNFELDVAIEDENCAGRMQQIYEEDLSNATEIVLGNRQRVRASRAVSRVSGSGGKAARAAAGALRIGNSVGAALTNRRALGPAEAGTMLTVGLFFVVLASVALVIPLAVTLPLALFAAWIAVTLLVRGWRMHRKSDEEDRLSR